MKPVRFPSMVSGCFLGHFMKLRFQMFIHFRPFSGELNLFSKF